MTGMTLQWNRCEGNSWCALYALNLGDEHFDFIAGVYVIWHGGDEPKVLRVGQGHIKDRLHEHKWEDDLIELRDQGETVFVTWAGMDADKRDPVERFLIDVLQPSGGRPGPMTRPLPVNLPWQG